jgi:septal ring factor EnvC (AmiA/AmiB activator)
MLLGILVANATLLFLVACDHLKKLVPHLKTLSYSSQYHNASKAPYVDMLCNYMQETLKNKDIQIAALQQELQLKCDAFTDCRTSQHSLEAASLQTKRDLRRKMHTVKLQKTQAEQQAKEAQQKLEAMQKQLLAAEKHAADAEAGKRPLSQNSFV